MIRSLKANEKCVIELTKFNVTKMISTTELNTSNLMAFLRKLPERPEVKLEKKLNQATKQAKKTFKQIRYCTRKEIITIEEELIALESKEEALRRSQKQAEMANLIQKLDEVSTKLSARWIF